MSSFGGKKKSLLFEIYVATCNFYDQYSSIFTSVFLIIKQERCPCKTKHLFQRFAYSGLVDASNSDMIHVNL